MTANVRVYIKDRDSFSFVIQIGAATVENGMEFP